MSNMWLCEMTETPVTRDDCLSCARARRVPECPFTPALLRAMEAAMEDDPALATLRQIGIPVIRVTDLVGCLRRAWYRQFHHGPLERPSAYWARLRGAIFHEALSRMGEGIVERRLAVSLERYGMRAVVTGRVDGYDPDARTLVDYKTVNAVNGRIGLSLPLSHHVEQLQLYAWLLHEAGFPPPRSGRLIYLTMADVRACEVEMPTREALVDMTAAVVKRAAAILEAGEKGPPGDPQGEWECRYCPYRDCPYKNKTNTKGG